MMNHIKKETLIKWVTDAVKFHKGKAHLIQVCKYVWENHENELRNSGDQFYKWQYDIRWAAQKLRDNGIFKKIPKNERAKGIWELA